ncbi:MAG: WD40/YVTN/BNR-like repeat-containing protein, partial [Candidatus Rokuibacteriota bacterium]
FLTGWSVFHAVVDPRDRTIHAATNNEVYGATVHRSTDRGETWTRAEELGLLEDTGLELEKTWHVEPGRDGEDGRLWLGAAPGVLFRTDDGGESWQTVDGIVRHETRDRWFPGAGGMCCHSIALDPEEADVMYVGISAAGVFRSEDGGETFTPANRGTAADFLPEPFPELGQCVHKLLLHPVAPTDCGSRTTAASTARTTGARAGSAWRATASPAASASRSRSTTATRTRRSSFRRRARRTASRPTGGSASTGPETAAARGSS